MPRLPRHPRILSSRCTLNLVASFILTLRQSMMKFQKSPEQMLVLKSIEQECTGVRNMQSRKRGPRYDCYLRSCILVRKVNWISFVRIQVCLGDTVSFNIIGFLIGFSACNMVITQFYLQYHPSLCSFLMKKKSLYNPSQGLLGPLLNSFLTCKGQILLFSDCFLSPNHNWNTSEVWKYLDLIAEIMSYLGGYVRETVD